MTPEFDLDARWPRRRAVMEQERRRRLNATCPHCGANLLHDLEFAANNCHDPMPSSVAIWCNGCDSEVAFNLNWHVELWSAEVTRQP